MKEKDEIEVSIICMTYNHGAYIQDALEGFVRQKTNFKYEIIIHDDASVDNTKDIICEYAKKYPDLIVPIIQKQNQYSQGNPVFLRYIYPKVRGKYVALCEGDDYWTDSNKLQLQYEAMENNPSCVICSHYTRIKDVRRNQVDKITPNRKNNLLEGIIDKKTQLYRAFDDVFHTSSLFIKKDIYIEFIKSDSEFKKKFNLINIGDLPLRLWMASKGDLFFVDREMSVYRVGTAGSWTYRMLMNNDNENRIKTLKQCLDAMVECQKFFNYKYPDFFEYAQAKYKAQIAIAERDHFFLLSKGNRNIIKCLDSELKFRLYLYTLFPFLIKVYHILKKKRV